MMTQTQHVFGPFCGFAVSMGCHVMSCHVNETTRRVLVVMMMMMETVVSTAAVVSTTTRQPDTKTRT